MIRTVNDLLTSYFGVRTNVETTAIPSVGTTAVKILRNDQRRVGLIVTNTGLVNVWIGFDQFVSTTRGFIVPLGGGSVTFDWQSDFATLAGEIWAVVAAGTTSLATFETFIEPPSVSTQAQEQ